MSRRSSIAFTPGLPGILAAASCLALSTPASADADAPAGFTIGAQPAWFLLGGITAGATVADVEDRGGFVGAELSLARLLSGRTLGIYADGFYDFGADGIYASTGIGLGWNVISLDAGATVRGDGDTDLGLTGRLCLSTGIAALCSRYSRFDSDRDHNVVQIGVILKLPLLSPFGGS
jgi:hypothetical protein